MDRLSRCFTKRDDCITREIAGETLIVPVRSRANELDSVFTLNELGTKIWTLIDGRVTVGQVIDAVCREYNVSPDEAQKDALGFFVDLEAAGLIHPCTNVSE